MRKPIKIKDPVYGYIEINNSKIYDTINSPLFQRLKDIIQTSYSSVYPASLHNRFIHSIGVYYLGTLAIKGIKENSPEIISTFDQYIETFLLACLLHDVGHSPFSHTGEKFYDLPTPQALWEKLQNEINDPQFFKSSRIGNPHEIMSALEAITYFPIETIEKEQYSFFVRCIIGFKYKDKTDVRNCFIELLNSSTIDVDKLDYLIRDSYYTGFKTITIDYERLLGSLTIINQNDTFSLAFTKAGLSTLESVILAHDMERKWLQNHPTILYENFLLESIIEKVIGKYSKHNISLFSLEALTTEGVQGTDGKTIRLLSDSDILYEAKNSLFNEPAVKEYFYRDCRKKALWKTESEYRMYMERSALSPDAYKQLEDMFLAIEKTLDTYRSKMEMPLINDTLLNFIEKEIIDSEKLEPEIAREKIANAKKALGLIKEIKAFSESKNYAFNYCFISTKQFYSGFNKEDFKKINVIFDEEMKPIELCKIFNIFEQEKPNDNLFYFYINKEDRASFNIPEFTKMITQYAFDNFRD